MSTLGYNAIYFITITNTSLSAPSTNRHITKGLRMKNTLKLADQYHEAYLVEKSGSTLLVQREGKTVAAFLPGGGNLDELLVPGAVVFISPSFATAYRYRVISSVYQDKFVLLDTWQGSRIVCELLARGMLMQPDDILEIETGARIGGRRIDLLLRRPSRKPLIVEVKTCPLCHNGVALWSDTQSESLQELASSEHDVCLVFLVPTGGGRSFIPDFHGDEAYARILMAAKNIEAKAVGVTLTDPVTVSLDSAVNLHIEYDTVRENLGRGGTYILVLENKSTKRIEVGKLGRVRFCKGYYVYVGSGMNGVDRRVARHYRDRKSFYWHIDYITPSHMPIKNSYTIRRSLNLEQKIVMRCEKISHGSIDGFGSSDSSRRSHLFFFPSPPYERRDFLDMVLDFMTFSEH